MIEFRGVTKIFGARSTTVRAVDDLSFVLPAGAFWAVMGPSGSGKSTLLHLVAALTPPTAGAVLVDGCDVAAMTDDEAAILRRRRIGYVLQSFNLMPLLTAEQNVGLPLLLDGVSRRDIDARASEQLARVGLTHRAAHRPAELSGGEQQRVAIARALVIQPSIILADEPTGNLDRSNGVAIMKLLRHVNEEFGVAVLMVTHDATFAGYAQRVVRLVDGSLVEGDDRHGSGHRA